MITATKKENRNQEQVPLALREIDKIAEIASFFGFIPIKTPEIKKEDVIRAGSFKASEIKSPFSQQEEKAALLRTYDEQNMASLSHPLMLYYKKPLSGQGERKKTSLYQCGLEIIGTSNSVAEALVIKTLIAILSEHGFENLVIDIHTLGDKDSMARFERELGNYVRKNISSLSPELRQACKKDVFEILRNTYEQDADTRDRAPKPMNFLSEHSIQHFKEVLEYLETLNIPYRINDQLLGERNFSSHTIFEIRGNAGEEENVLLATGSRHNYISKKVGFKKDIPIMSGSVCFKKTSETVGKTAARKMPRPKFYFVQLGFRARLKSLIIIDNLRKARIPVCHALMKEKLVNQLSTAETMKLSHLIIMGQKEALDDTVLIRNVHTRAQDIVNLADLSHYLQKLK